MAVRSPDISVRSIEEIPLVKSDVLDEGDSGHVMLARLCLGGRSVERWQHHNSDIRFWP
jgi:hypothetical protein